MSHRRLNLGSAIQTYTHFSLHFQWRFKPSKEWELYGVYENWELWKFCPFNYITKTKNWSFLGLTLQPSPDQFKLPRRSCGCITMHCLSSHSVFISSTPKWGSKVFWPEILHTFDLKITKLAKSSSPKLPQMISVQDLRVFADFCKCFAGNLGCGKSATGDREPSILPKKGWSAHLQAPALPTQWCDDSIDERTHTFPFQSLKRHTSWKSNKPGGCETARAFWGFAE